MVISFSLPKITKKFDAITYLDRQIMQLQSFSNLPLPLVHNVEVEIYSHENIALTAEKIIDAIVKAGIVDMEDQLSKITIIYDKNQIGASFKVKEYNGFDF